MCLFSTARQPSSSPLFSYTTLFRSESVPSNALERVLFLEADRMRGPRLTEENLRNQCDVVKEEIRVNVLNRPYGGFPRSEEHTSELQSLRHLVCRLLLEKKKNEHPQ